MEYKDFLEYRSGKVGSSSVNIISAEMYKKFQIYSEMLVTWNKKVNLTAITDPDDIMVKHFIDSIMLFDFFDIPQNAAVIDIGTGAGFPGLPLKICRNDVKLTLLDSLNKRINFLIEVSKTLGVDAVCVHSRAEDGGRVANLRDKFDVVVARAVAGMPVLCEYCLPYVKVGGVFAALKGPNEEIEPSLNAISQLGAKLCSIHEYKLPNGDLRKLFIIEKISQTSSKFPRNSAQIAKKSL